MFEKGYGVAVEGENAELLEGFEGRIILNWLSHVLHRFRNILDWLAHVIYWFGYIAHWLSNIFHWLGRIIDWLGGIIHRLSRIIYRFSRIVDWLSNILDGLNGNRKASLSNAKFVLANSVVVLALLAVAIGSVVLLTVGILLVAEPTKKNIASLTDGARFVGGLEALLDLAGLISSELVGSLALLAPINIDVLAGLNDTAVVGFREGEWLLALLAALLAVDLAAQNHTSLILEHIWFGAVLAVGVGVVDAAWFGGLTLALLVHDEALGAVLALAGLGVDRHAH